CHAYFLQIPSHKETKKEPSFCSHNLIPEARYLFFLLMQVRCRLLKMPCAWSLAIFCCSHQNKCLDVALRQKRNSTSGFYMRHLCLLHRCRWDPVALSALTDKSFLHFLENHPVLIP